MRGRKGCRGIRQVLTDEVYIEYLDEVNYIYFILNKLNNHPTDLWRREGNMRNNKKTRNRSRQHKLNNKIIGVAITIIVLVVAVVAYIHYDQPAAAIKTGTPTGPTTVSVDPASVELQNATIGQTIDVNVNITNVQNLWGFELDNLTFNPKVLNLTDVQEGPFLKTGGQTFFLSTLSATNWVQLGIVPSTNDAIYTNTTASGSGVLLTLKFTVLNAGVSPITISGVNNVCGPSAVTLYNNHEFEYQPETTTGYNGVIDCNATNGQITVDSII